MSVVSADITISGKVASYGAPARHEKSYLLQFVQTNCNLFEQIVICSNTHIIICSNKLLYCSLSIFCTGCACQLLLKTMMMMIICLFEQITI